MPQKMLQNKRKKNNTNTRLILETFYLKKTKLKKNWKRDTANGRAIF